MRNKKKHDTAGFSAKRISALEEEQKNKGKVPRACSCRILEFSGLSLWSASTDYHQLPVWTGISSHAGRRTHKPVGRSLCGAFECSVFGPSNSQPFNVAGFLDLGLVRAGPQTCAVCCLTSTDGALAAPLLSVFMLRAESWQYSRRTFKTKAKKKEKHISHEQSPSKLWPADHKGGRAHESTNAEELEDVSETIRMRLLQKLTATLSRSPRYFSFHAYKMYCLDCNILLCEKFSYCPYS